VSLKSSIVFRTQSLPLDISTKISPPSPLYYWAFFDFLIFFYEIFILLGLVMLSVLDFFCFTFLVRVYPKIDLPYIIRIRTKCV
jgi:hypothetical protein